MSRLRALFDVVPLGQWIPLDMDISGIWRFSGNYSFFGAPFVSNAGAPSVACASSLTPCPDLNQGLRSACVHLIFSRYGQPFTTWGGTTA
eukprot:COSAG03_NODE_1735_length_3585_cov_13.318703_4_plen_90_part_00